MHRLDQQFLTRTLMGFVLILSVIAMSATLSQAARLTADVLQSGLKLTQFGAVLLAMLPKMMELVTPLAFGLAVVLACVQRNEAGITLLLRAAGRSPRMDGLVLTAFASVAAVGLLILSGLVVPKTQGTYRLLFSQAEENSREASALPLQMPFQVGKDVTLTIGAHHGDGLYRDLIVVDASAATETLILRADQATLTPTTPGRAGLTLRDGSIQRIRTMDGRETVLSFTTTTIDLDHGAKPPTRTAIRSHADTQNTAALLRRSGQNGAALEELIRRVAAAASVVSFSVLAGTVLLAGRSKTSGHALSAVLLIAALVVFLLLQSALISASGFGQRMAVVVLAVSVMPLFVSPCIGFIRRITG